MIRLSGFYILIMPFICNAQINHFLKKQEIRWSDIELKASYDEKTRMINFITSTAASLAKRNLWLE